MWSLLPVQEYHLFPSNTLTFFNWETEKAAHLLGAAFSVSQLFGYVTHLMALR